MPRAEDGLWVYGPWPAGEHVAFGGVVVDTVEASKEHSIHLNKQQKIDAEDPRTRGLAAWANMLRGEQTSQYNYNADIKVDARKKRAVLVSCGIRRAGWNEVFCPYGRSFRV